MPKTTERPSATYSRRSATYSRRSVSYSRPSGTYSRPSATYSRRSASYSRPSGTYSRPSVTWFTRVDRAPQAKVSPRQNWSTKPSVTHRRLPRGGSQRCVLDRRRRGVEQDRAFIIGKRSRRLSFQVEAHQHRVGNGVDVLIVDDLGVHRYRAVAHPCDGGMDIVRSGFERNLIVGRHGYPRHDESSRGPMADTLGDESNTRFLHVFE